MAGHIWTPRVRMTPQNGAVETLNLDTGFLLNGFSTSVLTHIDLEYRPVIVERETVNRSKRPLDEGFRPTIKATFQIVDMALHYPTINRIQNRMRHPLWTVEWALDSGGLFYRVMVLVKPFSPDPFKKKTVAGSKFVMEVEARDPIDEIPDINGGTAW